MYNYSSASHTTGAQVQFPGRLRLSSPCGWVNKVAISILRISAVEDCVHESGCNSIRQSVGGANLHHTWVVKAIFFVYQPKVPITAGAWKGLLGLTPIWQTVRFVTVVQRTIRNKYCNWFQYNAKFQTRVRFVYLQSNSSTRRFRDEIVRDACLVVVLGHSYWQRIAAGVCRTVPHHKGADILLYQHVQYRLPDTKNALLLLSTLSTMIV